MAIKAVELIVSGEVQGVGYRGFVTRIARKLKLVGFAENLEDGTVRIQCKGEAASVDKFKELINIKNPPQASLIEVEGISEQPIEAAAIAGTVFKEKLGKTDEELAQGFATGNAYLGFVATSLGNKIDNLSAETKSGFSKMDTNFGVLANKYGKISETIGQVATTMTEISKNTKKLVQVAEKKDIFD